METFLELFVGVDRKWLWVGRIAVERMEEDQPAYISEGGTPPQPVHPSNQIRTISFPCHRSPAVPSSS